MTLTELRYIVAVARERHFGRAAEACFVSQPTLSVAIKKLEEELDCKIFERGGSEVSVTPIGEEIVRQAQQVIEQAQGIKEIAKRGKDPLSGPLRLGEIYTIGPYLLPDLVKQAIEKTPQMPLVLQENFTAKLLDSMLKSRDISKPVYERLVRLMARSFHAGMLARMMQTDLTVMITGESGTGKELVARALHEYGRRKKGPFVAINMAAIPRDLIESELFGHERGAFTGAQTRSTGRFEQANGGTLFLDEIGDMPMDAQTRLLRVLQQGEYTTVGGRTPIKTDVRIVAATNKDLSGLIEQGLFREDLFFRLNVVPLRLPPLRERSEDIADLTRHFFAQAQKEGLAPKHVTPDGIDLMRRYPWPGNVRELENLVRRLAALYPQDAIGVDILENELRTPGKASEPGPGASVSDTTTIAQAMEVLLNRYFSSFGGELPPPGLYQRVLAEVEHPLLMASLTATRGNQIKAAELLGLNRNTLRKKIRELGVNVYRTSNPK